MSLAPNILNNTNSFSCEFYKAKEELRKQEAQINVHNQEGAIRYLQEQIRTLQEDFSVLLNLLDKKNRREEDVGF